MDMDRFDLARLRAGRCDADRLCDAWGGDASRVGETVLDLRGELDPMGACDSGCAAAGPPAPSGEVAAHEDLADASRSVCDGGTNLRRVDDVAGFCLQPVCEIYVSGDLRAPLVRQVLQRDSLVPGAVCRDRCCQLCAGLERTAGAATDRDGATERASLEGAAGCSAAAD